MELAWVAGPELEALRGTDYYLNVHEEDLLVHRDQPDAAGGDSCRCGPETLRALIDAGTKLGVVFQIHDDVLNLSAGAKYGKQYADDLLEGKRTLILIRMLEVADARGEAEDVRALRHVQG